VNAFKIVHSTVHFFLVINRTIYTHCPIPGHSPTPTMISPPPCGAHPPFFFLGLIASIRIQPTYVGYGGVNFTNTDVTCNRTRHPDTATSLVDSLKSPLH